MHQFDQFKQDMEKLSKADLQNPIKSKQPGKIKSERSYLDATELNRTDLKPTNLYQFDEAQTFTDCTVLTIDGIDGFAWIDQNGTRHDEGFVWPTMRIHKDATVEILFGKNGERSAGWHKSDPSDLP